MAPKGKGKATPGPSPAPATSGAGSSAKSSSSSKKAAIVKSGNAGSSSSSAAAGSAPPTGPPPLFPPGYKTPLSLLNERCAKSSFLSPTVTAHLLPSPPSAPLYTASVTIRRLVPGTKLAGETEQISFKPPKAPSPIAVEKKSALEARHWAAVYAIFRWGNGLRLNIQLPPQTRDYWSALEAYKASAPASDAWLWSATPFEALAARVPPPPTPAQQLAKASANTSASSSRASTPVPPPPPLSQRWLTAPEVRMPTHLRDLVEQVLLSSSSSLTPDVLAPPLTLNDLKAPENHVYTQLLQIGFRAGQILSSLAFLRLPLSSSEFRASLASLNLHQACMTYLHLHTPENDLPASIKGSKPPDATARLVDTKNGAKGLARDWWIEKVDKETGFPRQVIGEVLGRTEDEDEGERLLGVTVGKLVKKLIGRDDEEDQEAQINATGGFEWKERVKDEIEALEGIYGSDRFRKISFNEVLGQAGAGSEELYEITIPIPKSTSLDEISLRVLFHSSYPYPLPSVPPVVYVHSQTLPTYITLHLTSLLTKHLYAPEGDCVDLIAQGGGGVVGELVAMLEDVWEESTRNPPGARTVLENLVRKKGAAENEEDRIRVAMKKDLGRGRNGARGKREPTQQDQVEMRKRLEKLAERNEYQKMLDVRKALPAWGMKESVVNLVENNRVVIVSGETGSGKTTQVPAFILDHAISQGRGCSTSIIITQPRRVSAIGVATRVAAERLEDIKAAQNGDNLVGYAIRGERKASRGCRMLFCTTGVVLARLARGGDPDLEGVSHVFVDEVHERSVDSDFLLLELRDLLKRNPKIKVILMSATINQKQFSDYFGGAPCIEIPGYTHPVQDHYLEEILPHLPFYRPRGKPVRKESQAKLDEMRSTFIARGVEDEQILQALEVLTRSERIDYALVGATTATAFLGLVTLRKVEYSSLCRCVQEIRQAIDAIREATKGERIEIFPLHANLSSEEQTAVFRPVREGVRKVVVATNVAETSITIDGIVYVIDCGRVKENTFDPDTSIVRLVETWTSKAASRQRRGRAGRTRPGECYKLFSHYTEENTMAAHPTPEIVRIPLEMLCLQIKAMRADEDVLAFLGKALDPPDVRAIQSAWATLKLLGALQDEGGMAARLTPLGTHLSMIPVDLRIGKMLILAAIFRCLDPILTVAALLSSKPLFLNPPDKRDEAQKARSMFYHSRSDLLSDVKAFDACTAARNKSNGELKSFAEESFISMSSYRDVLNLRHEYLTALSDVGFVPFRASPTEPGWNENASHENLLKAIIFAGTGRLVKVRLPPPTYDKGLSGAIERDRESREVKFFEKDGRVFLHPGSLLFSETRFASAFPLFTYFQKHVTTKPFLRDATEVPLYGLLLFGPKIKVDEHLRGLELGDDGWVVLRAWPRIGVLVNSLRALFNADLEANIEEPSWQGPTSQVVKAMLALLERDGGMH